MNGMIRTIIESPYAGDIDGNTEYARACMRDSIGRGEAPIASHLLYTQPGILNDSDKGERNLGISAGLSWLCVAQRHAFYVDKGFSSGMILALERSIASREIEIVIRRLNTEA